MTGIRGEAARKSIHILASLAAAAVVWRLDPLTAAIILAAAAGAALLVELLRSANPGFRATFEAGLGAMLRPKEARRLTGATTLALGYTAAAVLLPGRAALAGILFVGIGDALAAVVGRRWGRHRLPGGKSIEGSATFLTTAVVVCLALGATLPAAIAVATVLTVIEATSLPVDDNLYLTTAGAAVFRVIAGI